MGIYVLLVNRKKEMGAEMGSDKFDKEKGITRREAIFAVGAGGFFLVMGMMGCANNGGNGLQDSNGAENQRGTSASNTVTLSDAFSSQERVLWYEVIWGVGKDSDIWFLHVVENGEVTTYSVRQSMQLGQVAKMADDEIIRMLEASSISKRGPVIAQAVIRTDKTGNTVSSEGVIDSNKISTIGETSWFDKSSVIGEREWINGTESASEVYTSTYAGFRGPAGDTHVSLIRRIDSEITFALDDVNTPGVIVVD